MRAPDGLLFAVDTSASIFDQRKPIPRTAASESSVQPSEAGTTTKTPTGTPADKQQLRGLDILRRKVQQYWIQGNRVLIEQGI